MLCNIEVIYVALLASVNVKQGEGNSDPIAWYQRYKQLLRNTTDVLSAMLEQGAIFTRCQKVDTPINPNPRFTCCQKVPLPTNPSARFTRSEHLHSHAVRR